jgi:hypothetical protein
MFPHFEPPHCKDEYYALLDRLSDLRRKAVEKPLRLPHDLMVVDQCTDPRPPDGTTEILNDPQLPSQHQPKQRARVFPEFSSPEDMQVVLVEAIQTGEGGWAQVYAGRFTIGTRSCDVIVKLYQECMFRKPYGSEFYGMDKGEWPSATEVAQCEAWAYQMLEQYQGSTIPYSYGFYNVTSFSSIFPRIDLCRLTVPAPK